MCDYDDMCDHDDKSIGQDLYLVKTKSKTKIVAAKAKSKGVKTGEQIKEGGVYCCFSCGVK